MALLLKFSKARLRTFENDGHPHLLELATGAPTLKKTVDQKLAELGIELPDAPAPAANYVPFVQIGNLIYISGQIPIDDAGIVKGKLGRNMETSDGVAAAKLCALALLAQVHKALDGNWWRLKRAVKLTAFVNSTEDFTEQPTVVNGASDLLVELLGEAGEHVRSAVSAPSLPLGAAVEIEGIFEIDTRTMEDITMGMIP